MTRRHHIMILDDEPNIGLSLRLILEGEGYRVTICDSAARFQAERGLARADLYLLDVRLPDGNGIDVLRSLKQADDPAPVVMISGHATIRDAVEATRSGAFDFLEKPLARDAAGTRRPSCRRRRRSPRPRESAAATNRCSARRPR